METDWLDLQSRLREPWERFFRQRSPACYRARIGVPGLEDAVDAVVRAWVRGGTWPTLTAQEEDLLGIRLHWAFSWVTALANGVPGALFAFAERDDEEVLEWLLVDSWRRAGGFFLRFSPAG